MNSHKGWTQPTLDRLGVQRAGGRWVFPLRDAMGEPCGVVRYDDAAPDARSKMRADPGTTRELWPRPEDVPGPILHVVEGEPDAVSMAELGIAVVAFPGVGKWRDEWARRLARNGDSKPRERVVIVPDCDPRGRAKALTIAAKIAAFGVPVFVAEIDRTRDDGYDMGDVLVDLGASMTRRFVAVIDERAERVGPGAEPEPAASESTSNSDDRAPWPGPMADAAYHGLAGQFVRTVGPHSEADPAALLVQFLAVFGCIVGTQAGWKVDGAFHPGRLWPLLVGDTSRGRKGTAAARVREVMDLAAPGWWGEHARSGLASGEGVVWHVRDPIRKRRTPRKGETVDADGFVVEDEGVTDKRLLAHEAEFAHVLAVMRREGNTLSTGLREFWDHGTYGTLTKHEPLTATGAHVVVVGHVTARELRERLTGTDQANGFGNRFLVVCVERSRVLPFGGSLDAGSLSLLAGRIGQALGAAGGVHGQVEMSDAARDLWASVYGELSAGGDDLFASMTARAEAQVIRLAVVYALTDGAPTIDLPHLLAALAVWRYCEDSAAHVFGGRTGNSLAERLLSMIRDAEPGGITRGELRHGISHDTPTARFDSGLAHLERCLLARCERQPAGPRGGRPAERWFAEPGPNRESWDETSGEQGCVPSNGDTSRRPASAVEASRRR